MEENKNVNENINENADKKVIAPNLKEILDKIAKNKKLTGEQISILQKEAQNSLEFMKLVESIELPKDNYVIFTDGEEQLVYDNGEFFIVSTTDSTKEKKKKKRLEAKDMYIEYFIRYTLNKINPKQTESIEIVKEKSEKNEKVQNKEKEEKEKVETIKEKKSDEKRAEEIRESLKNMVTPVTEDYERSKIINKIKNGNEKSEKVR